MTRPVAHFSIVATGLVFATHPWSVEDATAEFGTHNLLLAVLVAQFNLN